MTDIESLLEQMQSIELSEVAITAAMDADGTLHPVGGLYEKLRAVLNENRDHGKIAAVTVSDQQDNVVEGWLRGGSAPVRVLRAANLEQAVAKLYEEHGPRQAIRQQVLDGCRDFSILGRPVPMDDKHYQPLPLLQEVERKRLPREKRSGSEDGGGVEDREATEDRSVVDARSILIWEEEVRGWRVDYSPVGLADLLRSGIPRAVVTAPPGAGKSTLAQRLAVGLAAGEYLVGGRRMLPILVSVREWAEAAKSGLPEYLRCKYRSLPGRAPDAERIRRWLQRGEVFLLFDGLDEVSNKGFVTTISETLRSFPACPAIVTCRTVSYESFTSSFDGFDVYALSGLERGQRNAFVEQFPAKSDNYAPASLCKQLDRTPAMAPIATNPLILSIICLVAESGMKFPATRGELYEQATERLFWERHEEPRRVDLDGSIHVVVEYPAGLEPDPVQKRRMLEHAALELFGGVDDQRKLAFSRGLLLDALQRGAEIEDLDKPGSVAACLLRDLEMSSGLIRVTEDGKVHFLHLTVHEFLAANALASVVNKKGWRAAVRIDGRRIPIRRLVDAKSLDPAWEGVVVLLAGKLDDPVPLLDILMTDGTEFRSLERARRYRLALAGLCLPEIKEQTRPRCKGVVDAIATELFEFWWGHRLRQSWRTIGRRAPDPIPHITRSMQAVVQAGGRVRSGHGTAAVTEILVPLLSDEDSDVRMKSALALVTIVPSLLALPPEVLKHAMGGLLQSFEDTGWAEWLYLADGITALNAAASVLPDEFLTRAVDGLVRNLERGEERPVEALCALGPLLPALPPDVHARLVRGLLHLLENRGGGRGFLSSSCPATIGAALSALPADHLATAVDELLRLLDHENWKVREASARALAALGPSLSALPPEVLKGAVGKLLQLPEDDEERVREASVGALSVLASLPGISPEDRERAVAGLIRLLEGPYAIAPAHDVLGDLGPCVSAVPPEDQARLVDALIQLLEGAERPIVLSNLSALSGLGPHLPALPPGAQARLVRALLRLLNSRRPIVRECSARALGELGPCLSAVPPDVREHLAEELLRLFPDLGWVSAEALGALGPSLSVLAPDVLAATTDALLGLLEEEESAIRDEESRALEALAEALGGLGPSLSAVPRELRARVADGLLRILESADWHSEHYYANANFRARRASTEALARLDTALSELPPESLTQMVSRLLQLLNDKDWTIRLHSSEALGELSSSVSAARPEVQEWVAVGLLQLLRDEDLYVRMASTEAIGKLLPCLSPLPTQVLSETVCGLLRLLKSRDDYERRTAVHALGQLGFALRALPSQTLSSVVDGLLEVTRHGDHGLEHATALALDALRPSLSALPPQVPSRRPRRSAGFRPSA